MDVIQKQRKMEIEALANDKKKVLETELKKKEVRITNNNLTLERPKSWKSRKRRKNIIWTTY